jgi:hypothetical protein
MSEVVMSNDLNTMFDREIENIIKKVAIYKATCVKNTLYDAYKIIMSQEDALLLVSNEYNKTYKLFYKQLMELYKSTGNNIKINDLLNYQLTDTINNSSTLENKLLITENNVPVENKLLITENNVPVKNKLLITENNVPVKNKLLITENNVPVENKLLITENNVPVKNKLLITENNVPVENNCWHSPRTKQFIINSNNKKLPTLKIIKHKLNTQQNLTNFDFKHNINEMGKKYAKNIIDEHDITIGTSIIIDCKDNNVLKTINNIPILKSKFLDSTYVDANSKLHSSTHHNFKNSFLKLLEERYGKEHNLHVNFTKDSNNDMVFTIYFSEAFKNKMEISNNKLGTKIIIR